MSKAVTEIAIGAGLFALDFATFGIGTAAHIAIQSALLGAGSSLIMGGIGSLLQTQHKGIASNMLNPVAPWNVVYGRARVGGTTIWQQTNGDTDKYWHRVIVLACHPSQSVDALLFDNKRVCLDTSGNSLSFGDSTAVIASQQTVNISTISRTNDVVTVVMASAMPLPASTAAGPALMDGDTVQIQNVSTDQTLNGQYQIQVVNSTTFTYICGGSAVSISGQGSVKTQWPDYGDTVHLEIALGNQSAGSPPFPGLLATDGTGSGGTWTSNHLALGHTVVYLRMKYGGNTYQSGIPQIGFLLHGKNNLYDPRTGTNGYTENSALCIADYLCEPTWGFKCNYGTDVPTSDLSSKANICDESVTLASGGTEPRYTCNGSFQLNAKRGEILQNLLTSCAGRLTYSGGQFFIWPAAWYGTNATFKQDGLANFGSNSALYVQGDWSAGLWINLPSDAHGSLIAMVDAGSTDPTAAAPYVLTVTGSSSGFGIEYVHDYGTSAGIAGHEYLPFSANIPANTWIYVGVSRNSTAKTVTLYTSDGTTVTTVGTQSYTNTPGISPGLAELTLGEFFYRNMASTPSNSLFYPAISEIASAYMWSADLTSAQHLSAAQGSLPATGLIFDVGNVGANPPTSSTSATGTITSTLTNTTVVNGPNNATGTARLFGQTAGTAITAGLNNMAGPFQWKPKLAVRDLYNGVKATYVCPANNWQPSDMPPYAQDASHGYSSDANMAADGNERRWLDLQFPFTNSTATAQRLAKIELLRRRMQGMGTFVFNLAMYQVTALDVVEFTLAPLNWTNKLLEITAHRFTVSKQQNEKGSDSMVLGTELDVQETDPSIYSWNTSEELTAQGYQQPSLVGTQTITAPTTVSATNSTVTGNGITQGQVQVTWSAPTDGFVSNGGQTIVQYSMDDKNWIPLGIYDSSVTTAFVPNVAAGQTYWVRVSFVNVAGVQSGWTVYGPITATGSSVNLNYYTTSWTSQTSVTATHNLGTANVLVQVRDTNSVLVQPESITITSSNVVTLSFGAAFSGSVLVFAL